MVAILHRFMVLSSAAADAEALWCLHSWVHDQAVVSPTLCLRSEEKRCGKTRNLQLLGCMVRRPLHAANVTVAALMRAIDQFGPTLLMDEADTIFVRGGRAELRGVLNAGLYRSTAFVLRCVGDRRAPKACSVWCPKAIALIGRLPATLEDRSITISLRRRGPDDHVELLPPYDRLFAELGPVRRKAVRWAIDHINLLADIVIHPPETLHDRSQDLWRPLLAIAEVAGGSWINRARRAAVELSRGEVKDHPPGVHVLDHLRWMFETNKTDRLSSEAIVSSLARDERPPQGPWPSTKTQLARTLVAFGIRPTIVYRSRTQVRRGYRLDDCRDAFARLPHG
jgi:putative DNA primase/helicase